MLHLFQNIQKQIYSKHICNIYARIKGYFFFLQAEERLAMIEEQMRFEQEKQKLKKREDKRLKEEQKKILGKGNVRPKLSFSLGASS